MNKIRVAVICGGRSAEHEVSLQSAKNIIDAIDKNRFEPLLIAIGKDGVWTLKDSKGFLVNNEDPRNIKLKNGGSRLFIIPNAKSFFCAEDRREIAVDAAFPVLHGPFGEDGTVQGLLKLAGIPFAGAGVCASAVGMDKDVMKRLLRDSGIKTGKFLTYKAGEEVLYEEAEEKLGVPLFIKPSNMGSSIGISKVHGKSEWEAAIKEAFKYDNKIIMEENIEGREIECAVLDTGKEVVVSLPGEIKSAHEFYSYDAKYIDQNGARLFIPAELPEDAVAKVREAALQTFRVLCCEGLARIDFFISRNGEIFVNEINTMPGFTKISMYPKLISCSNISYTGLISRLIDAAVYRFENESRLLTSYGTKCSTPLGGK